MLTSIKNISRYHLALILIGQFISGVGTIPLFAFPPAIFRETFKEKYIPTCLAFWQASVFIGPLIAFAISEPILETWVDITEVIALLSSELSHSFDFRIQGNYFILNKSARTKTFSSSLARKCTQFNARRPTLDQRMVDWFPWICCSLFCGGRDYTRFT